MKQKQEQQREMKRQEELNIKKMEQREKQLRD